MCDTNCDNNCQNETDLAKNKHQPFLFIAGILQKDIRMCYTHPKITILYRSSLINMVSYDRILVPKCIYSIFLSIYSIIVGTFSNHPIRMLHFQMSICTILAAQFQSMDFVRTLLKTAFICYVCVISFQY